MAIRPAIMPLAQKPMPKSTMVSMREARKFIGEIRMAALQLVQAEFQGRIGRAFLRCLVQSFLGAAAD